MYETLYQYFIQHKRLQIPGIGTFLLARKTAESDFINKRINPPVYSVSLQSINNTPPANFFKWLSAAFKLSDREAIIRFNDFAFDMKNQIINGDIIDWKGIGIFSKGPGNEIKFSPSINIILEEPVIAAKVIRENAAHMVRVGEDEKTSVEMTEMLGQSTEKRSYWWAYALAIAVLGVMFIGWYFWGHGMNISSTANGKKLVPAESAATYQTLP